MTEPNGRPSIPPPLPARPGARSRGKGRVWAAWLGGSVLLVILAVGVSRHVLRHKGLFAASGHGVDEYPNLEETWSCGQGDTKAARIDISGVIMEGKRGSLFSLSRDPVETALRSIRTAMQDPAVKAIILVVDSPGGGITASDVIYNELLKFKKSDPSRRIVALFGDLAASGGYYVSCAADRVVAHPTTITGSIGVIISSLNIKGLGEKVGIKAVTIVSGENKDMLNPFKDLTESQQKLLQATVDEMYKRFVRIVAEGRHLSEDEVVKVADGRILTAPQALESKLIDRIGYWDDAMEETRHLLKVGAVKVVKYREPFSWSLFAEAVQKIDISAEGLLSGNTRLMYILPF